MLAPIQTLLTQLLDQAMTLAPVIIGLAVFMAGVIVALGNHGRGREMGIAAAFGGVLMLGAKTIAANIHP